MTRWSGRNRADDNGFPLGRVRVLHITSAALKLELLDHPEWQGDADGVWMPKSQIHLSSEIDNTALIDEEGQMIVTTWIAGQKGFA